MDTNDPHVKCETQVNNAAKLHVKCKQLNWKVIVARPAPSLRDFAGARFHCSQISRDIRGTAFPTGVMIVTCAREAAKCQASLHEREAAQQMLFKTRLARASLKFDGVFYSGNASGAAERALAGMFEAQLHATTRYILKTKSNLPYQRNAHDA